MLKVNLQEHKFLQTAMVNIYNGVAAAVRGRSYRLGAFPTVHDGVRGMSFIEAVLSSNSQEQVWVNVK